MLDEGWARTRRSPVISVKEGCMRGRTRLNQRRRQNLLCTAMLVKPAI